MKMGVLLQREKRELSFSFIMAVFLLLCSSAAPLNDDEGFVCF